MRVSLCKMMFQSLEKSRVSNNPCIYSYLVLYMERKGVNVNSVADLGYGHGGCTPQL